MSSTPVCILLVDDKPENLLALEELLKQPDRHIIRAGSGNEALRLLLKHEVALVLLDVQMPEMDGYETAQLMRGAGPTRSVPIIFLTAGDRSEERAFRGFEVGAVDFLYKPINPLVLQNKVDVFVQLHRRNQDLRVVNAALERTSAVLSEKVADLENVNRTISHDLRAPVRALRGFTQLLEESLEGRIDSEARHFMSRITLAADRMTRMLDDLYALLRMSASAESFPLTDCKVVLRDVLADVGGDLEAAGAVVTSDEMPTIRASPVLLGQILQNLISNAIKFRADGRPHIHVGAEAEAGGWRFSVRDDGAGIPEDAHTRIFDLFTCLRGDGPGTGVGLALCKRAVEKHGGRIWVESRPREGSTFYFTIPERIS